MMTRTRTRTSTWVTMLTSAVSRLIVMMLSLFVILFVPQQQGFRRQQRQQQQEGRTAATTTTTAVASSSSVSSFGGMFLFVAGSTSQCTDKIFLDDEKLVVVVEDVVAGSGGSEGDLKGEDADEDEVEKKTTTRRRRTTILNTPHSSDADTYYAKFGEDLFAQPFDQFPKPAPPIPTKNYGLYPSASPYASHFAPQPSGCWRSHTVTWKIRDDKLFLVDIDGMVQRYHDGGDDKDDEYYYDSNVVQYFFPNEQAPIQADWVSGKFEMNYHGPVSNTADDDGIDCCYGHNSFGYVCLTVEGLLVDVKRGKVISIEKFVRFTDEEKKMTRCLMVDKSYQCPHPNSKMSRFSPLCDPPDL